MFPISEWTAYVLTAALVGLLLIHAWRRWVEGGPGVEPAPISILIIVRDHEDEIEAFMRPLLGRPISAGPPRVEYELVVVDAGSGDDTWAILSRLAYRRPGLRLLRWHGAQGTDPFQAGRLICRHPVTITVDLTTGADLGSARATLARLIGGARSGRAGGPTSRRGPSALSVQPDQDPAGS